MESVLIHSHRAKRMIMVRYNVAQIFFHHYHFLKQKLVPTTARDSGIMLSSYTHKNTCVASS